MNFEFQLVLTEKCNLACKYCYIDQKPESMTKDTFDKHYSMLDLFLQEYGCKNYHAALFGGEPLLNWELFEYIIPIFKKDDRCNFIIVMTNGLLLKDDYKRDFIEKNNIALSLSFDGLWNKNNRVYHDNKSSFDEYISEPLKSYFSNRGGCKVMVAPNNIVTMTENFVWFVEEYGINNPDFSLVRDDIWGGEDVKLYEIECKRLADKVIEYHNKGINANVGLFQLYTLDLIFGKTFGKRPFSCFAGHHGAAFMPNGLIYPCARFGSNKALCIGNSNRKILGKSLCKSLKSKINPKEFFKCLECDLYNYCNTGCNYNQILNEGPIDNLCKILKITYKESIRITNVLKNNKIFQQSLLNSIKNVG